MKAFGIGLLVLVGFVGLGVAGTALNIITIPWLKLNSQVQMNRDIVQKTYNADNALYNYHWFKEREQALLALKETIAQSDAAVVSFEQSAGSRKDWTFEDKTEDARLRSVSQGQKAQYNSLAGEYNAHMKEADRSLFAEELPLFFNLLPF